MQGSQYGRASRVSAYASALLLSSAILSPVLAQQGGSGEEEIVVTAQRRSEAIQKVPIAVSAFGQDQLQKSKLDGGPDLVKAVPNVTFAKSNFTGYNFQIRGIGSKLVAASGDAGTGIHFNGAPQQSNNLFEAEFFDVERVEVLRGPQGTLYGRNATGGVVNVITNKPKMDYVEGMGRFEYGNYDSIKARAMLNIPLGEMFAVRAAGAYHKRSGFGDNVTTGNDADDRDLFNTRLSLAFEPDPAFRAVAIWDHFEEDDNRSRVGKQICVKDPGDTSVGGVGLSSDPVQAGVQRGYFSQGCLAESHYHPDRFGTINGQATLGGLFGTLSGAITGDSYAGKFQDPDIRNTESFLDSVYQSKTDIYELQMDWDITDTLTLSSLTSYTEFELFTQADYFRYLPNNPFNSTPNPVNLYQTVIGLPAPLYNAIYASVFPGGIPVDPQIGNSNLFQAIDISSNSSEQFFQEFRLQSDFDGPINFSVGGNYIDYEQDARYYVMFNTGTSFYRLLNTLSGMEPCPENTVGCVFIDPEPLAQNRRGHNYYVAYSPYELESMALFGEVYWEITDEFKLTGGLRYTDDQKTVFEHYVTLGVNGTEPNLVGLGATGSGDIPREVAKVDFQEVTGRIGFDWNPDWDATDSTLVYAFYSRGYKAGGLNSPCTPTPGISCGPRTFEPEFINAYELGTKNTLADGSVQLNLSLFYYDYQGYQVSKIVNRASTNENIDAEVWGAEFESMYEPVDGLRFNLNIGWLDTEITSGTSIDTFNRTASDPRLTVVKSSAASNCVVTTAHAAAALALANATNNPFVLSAICTPTSFPDPDDGPIFLFPGGPQAIGTNDLGGLVSDGVSIDLSGNELPNAPEWTVSFGAQYAFMVSDDWEMTIRGDYYYQSGQFTRIYNSDADKLKSWDNLNFTVTLANEASGWQVDAYVKNAMDDSPIVDSYLTDDSSGLFRNAFYQDPRTFGIGVTYNFHEEEEAIEAPAAPPPAPAPAKTFIVFFNFDKSDLTPEAQTVIREAAAAYQAGANVNLRVQVRGHTDTVGSAAYNMALSERRAASVASGLTAAGVPGEAISTSGAGFSEPLVPTGPGVKEPQNRRATIDLTGAGS